MNAPASFGVLMRQWRRRRGMSQLELAAHGQVSQRHVSFLESGRARPSREMVMHLSALLDVPLRERNRLLGAAGFAAAFRESALDAPQLAEARHALNLILKQHDPFPAVVVDGAWNLLSANVAAQRMLHFLSEGRGHAADQTAGRVPNLMRLPLDAAGLRPFIEDWPALARDLLHRLQRESLEHPAAASLLAEVRGLPDIDSLWREIDWDRPPRALLPMTVVKDGLRLSLISVIATFGTPQDVTLQDLRIESFFPADEQTEQVFRQLAAA